MSAPHLLHVFATFAPGGPQVRTARLMNALGSEFRHSVIAMDGETGARHLVSPEVPFELVERPGAGGGSFETVRAFREFLPSFDHDLLLTYNWGSIDAVLAAATSRTVDVVHHEDGFLPDEARRFKFRRVLTRAAVLRSAKAVVVPSQTLESIAMQRWKLPAARVQWIPNGIDPTGFPAHDGNKDLRRRFDIPEDVFLVGSVGHLRAEKNLARLLNACARLGSDAHLLIVGDGAQRGMLEARAAQRDLAGRVHFTGHREDLGELYRTMDLFAMSSDTEQMPVALLEAMCAGLPVAATDVGDITRILPADQREFVVGLDPDPVTQLAAALERMAGDLTLRRTLGIANRMRVSERFTFGGMVDAYRKLYRLGARGGS